MVFIKMKVFKFLFHILTSLKKKLNFYQYFLVLILLFGLFLISLLGLIQILIPFTYMSI